MEIQDGTAKFRVRDKNEDRVPTGIVQFFAGSKTPKGWLVCDGSAVSRTEYDELFEVLGTIYGAGDGSTTFNLPNLIDRFAEGGKNVGTKKNAGLPNITGSSRLTDNIAMNIMSDSLFLNAGFSDDDGALYGRTVDATHPRVVVDANPIDVRDRRILNFDASRSNAIYGASDTVQPPALVLLPIIKY